MTGSWWMVLLVGTFLLAGCPPEDHGDDDAADDDAADDDTGGGDDDTGGGDDDVADDDAGDDDSCSGYRTQYPSGPYGVNVGSVLEDFPGMVDGQGSPHDLEEIFADTSKVALVIANAFDT